MPLTNAQKQHRARKKKAATLARYEAALRGIANDGFGVSRDDLVDIARQALTPTTTPYAGERDE